MYLRKITLLHSFYNVSQEKRNRGGEDGPGPAGQAEREEEEKKTTNEGEDS